MDILSVIGKRRDGLGNSEAELRFLASGAGEGSIPDYQLAAWLMAAFLRPLDEQETAWLTLAMAESGDRIDLSGLPKPWVDKHSTGGVGDKTTIALLPILAACGLTIVKMSGRGLGITGGTVDKLASIPGFRLDLSPDEMKRQAAQIGLALTGQTPDLAPADKALYALRDVTGTVGSIPLIVSSILSKKIAGGADTVVLDVKCGSGAFMTNLGDAQKLAALLEKTGTLAGLKVKTSISDMNQPLGAAVGNALEVSEAFAVLRGDRLSPPVQRFRRLCLHYAAETLVACGSTTSEAEGLAMAEEALISGKALLKAKDWVKAQGGDPRAVEDSSALPRSAVVREVRAEDSGWVKAVSAETIGKTVINLGGGRHRKEDLIDPAVGIVLAVGVGAALGEGDLLATVHAATEEMANLAVAEVLGAIELSETPVEEPPLFLS